MKKILILFVYYLASCQNQECKCVIDTNLISQNDSTINAAINSPRRNLVDYWNKFNEPAIHQLQVESYRFSITVLLYDYFKVYRVERRGNDYNLHIKEYAVSTTAKEREDSLVSNISKKITKSEWTSIDNAFKENCFWTMSTHIKSDDNYLDGSSWLLEGYKSNSVCTNNKYHIAGRRSPGSSSFRMICEKFLEFDSLNVRDFH
jgi:hypothetical protein